MIIWEVLDLKKREDREGILEHAADAFDIPGEVLAGTPRVTVTGCRRVVIENHKGILEYGENRIVINGGRVIVKLRGEELELRAMNTEELLITGTIFSIDFDY